MSWQPKVLLEHEIGYLTAMAEIMLRSEKPLCSLTVRRASEEDIKRDLQEFAYCAGAEGKLFPWVRGKEGDAHVLCGFYTYPWVINALDFIHEAKIDPNHKAWMSGLLFGYSGESIQKFFDTNKERMDVFVRTQKESGP